MALPILTPNQIEQIARIMGDTEDGFTGSEIGHHLAQCHMADPNSGLTKWKRLYNAFCVAVNGSGSTNIVFQFIQHCLDPAQGLNNPERYNWMRLELNKVLMFLGIEIRDDGQFYSVSQARSLGEVQRRTKELRDKLTGYGAHSEVLRCCRNELLAQDYFHAVQEAAKSLCDRVRTMSGLSSDGTELFQTAFSVKNPYIAYNSLRTSSEQNQQNGLKEMLCGVIHMIRNVTAHELRIHWDVNEKDAVDILTQISYLHKLLDVCTTVPRMTP
jgi:uncharacterized protein (TIGR02391 family)